MHPAHFITGVGVQKPFQGLQRALPFAQNAVPIGNHYGIALVPMIDILLGRFHGIIQVHQLQQLIRQAIEIGPQGILVINRIQVPLHPFPELTLLFYFL